MTEKLPGTEAIRMLRHCVVLGVEGTCGPGKTTLSYALAAYYRELGITVTVVEDQARHSPFIEEILTGGWGGFDVAAEADLFAAQLSAQLRAARRSEMIICDTTTASVLAYAWLVLQAPPRSPAAAAIGAIETFCRALASAYDAVFYCCDRFRCDLRGTHGEPGSWTCSPQQTGSSAPPAPPSASESSTFRRT